MWAKVITDGKTIVEYAIERATLKELTKYYKDVFKELRACKEKETADKLIHTLNLIMKRIIKMAEKEERRR